MENLTKTECLKGKKKQMKLVAIPFAGKEWNIQEAVIRPCAVLPMHAEKWFLIQKQGDWDGILRKVDIFVADGVGLAWGYRFLTGKKVQKISGIDLINQLIEQKPKTKTFIWGTTEKNIIKAAKLYKQRGLNVVGFHNGFSGKDEDILVEIKKSGAEIVFVGMGARRAAELVVKIKEELGISAMTAGGSFDVASGEFKRAPIVFQRVGLEWLWRMIIEPKRIKRLPALLGFVYYVLREKLLMIRNRNEKN
jgi:N-acetylglucosaminyldiphosphoundecaprenol N-acetyl-beta-D-mannosaminyltransferase